MWAPEHEVQLGGDGAGGLAGQSVPLSRLPHQLRVPQLVAPAQEVLARDNRKLFALYFCLYSLYLED